MGEAKNTEAVELFIKRWQGREGDHERANYASFLNELIAVLGLPKPDPAAATHEHNDYVFERAVKKHQDEGDSQGRIDLYRKNSFVLEAKQSRLKGVKKVPGQNDLFTADIPEDSRGRRGADRAWGVLMLNAQDQAEEYAPALPPSARLARADAQRQASGGRIRSRASHLARLATVYPHLRCRALHRGLCRLLWAREELHPVSRPADLPDLSRRSSQRSGPRAS